MTAGHHHDGEAVVASRPRGWTQARCKAAWTRAEEEKPESSPLWTRPRCPLRPRALLRRRCPPSPPTSRRTRPARAPRTPPRPPLPRGVSSPRGDSTRKLRSTYALSRRVTEGMISGDADPSPWSCDAVAAAVLNEVLFVFPAAGCVVPGPSGEERGRQGYRRSFSLWADSDPRWSDDLACHASKSGKNVKIFSFLC